ncbi:antibiotic biosynthesis monooxygenase [Xanthomonas sp. NCPPB 3582]|uniref:antibiotic biosynthesis monooxygenase family protein n=1 Tax=Xanthomonas sp. NCPPB 3582 TaxID=487557 RepID=UPI0035580D15
MSRFEPLDPTFPLARQVDTDAEAAFLRAWSADALFMKHQPGYISTQLHRALGKHPTYLNYAVFDSVDAWKQAFRSSEFQEKLKAHPASLVERPHLFTKVAIANLCTA